jgi:hypothetical protein
LPTVLFLGRPDALARHLDAILAAGSTRLSGIGDQIRGASSPAPAPPFGTDHSGDLREGLGWEGCPHFVVSGLVPFNAGDRPDLREEAWMVAVHCKIATVEPLDLSIAPGDDREPLGISRDSQPKGSGEVSKVMERGIRRHSIRRRTLRVPH